MGESMICYPLWFTAVVLNGSRQPHKNIECFLLAINWGRSRSYGPESGLFREVGLPRELVPGYVPVLALIFRRDLDDIRRGSNLKVAHLA